MTILLVMVAGAVGAVARFVVDGAVKHRRPARFPWATLVINVTGSLLLGAIAGLVIFHSAPDELKVVIGTGFCGGYTTFSTASFESVRLVEGRQGAKSLVYPIASLVGSVVGCVAGLALASIG
ncbi:fluoride efflux transporter CrcB [Gordonia sp. ABSL11-1]|uniref:fluoride efflux transporter CrcB n=1 Tax=Gordonia sp. ABSL11-1 TaxID=3053924 RepID=UPI0025732EA9|nr:fluoride efflux transporter CrcB [Gordonia sp. ABSL11-1]MDL9948791.1 fluoride efflux transporter CrcB [Gordonia sp. ABSL11-1]